MNSAQQQYEHHMTPVCPPTPISKFNLLCTNCIYCQMQLQTFRELLIPAEVVPAWLTYSFSFRYINNALKFDEQGQSREALQLYHKGNSVL